MGSSATALGFNSQRYRYGGVSREDSVAGMPPPQNRMETPGTGTAWQQEVGGRSASPAQHVTQIPNNPYMLLYTYMHVPIEGTVMKMSSHPNCTKQNARRHTQCPYHTPGKVHTTSREGTLRWLGRPKRMAE